MKSNIYSKSDFSVLNINSIGHSDDPAITKYIHGKRWLYIIHYVISGKGYFNGNELREGQGFLITPGVSEEYHADEAEPWEFLWVISSDEAMERLIPAYGADEKTGIFTYGNIDAAKSLAAEVDKNNKRFYSGTEMLEKFLHLFNSHRIDAHYQKGCAADNYFDFSVNYISSNLHAGVKIQALTELLGITQVYLFKIFMTRVGKSPKQYIEDLKFIKAKKMLLETDLSISAIAQSVGYDDPLAFSKFFARRTGLFPQKYKASQLNGGNDGI